MPIAAVLTRRKHADAIEQGAKLKRVRLYIFGTLYGHVTDVANSAIVQRFAHHFSLDGHPQEGAPLRPHHRRCQAIPGGDNPISFPLSLLQVFLKLVKEIGPTSKILANKTIPCKTKHFAPEAFTCLFLLLDFAVMKPDHFSPCSDISTPP